MKNWDNKLTGNFTTVPNVIVTDREMSAKAKGVLLYLASRPNDWQFYMEEICSNFTDGITAIKSAVKELEKNGYLTRERMFDSKTGQLRGYKWTLHMKETHQAENPTAGKPSGRETLPHTNTDLTKTELTNTDLTKKKGSSVFVEKAKQLQDTVDLWNETYGTEVRITDKKRQQLNARLKNFTIEEIHKAIRNRAENEWLKGDGHAHRGNWDSLFRNDERVEKYLNAEKPKQETAKPFYGYNMPREYY